MAALTSVCLLLGLWLLPVDPTLGFTSNEDDQTFVVPLENGLGVEFYDRGDARYGIFRQTATWHEANKLCAGNQGSLIEYTTEDIPVFMGRALAESAIGFTSLWIGGQFTPSAIVGENGEWMWTKSKQPIDAELSQVEEFPMTTSPFWVDRPDPTATQPLCLATDRNMHHMVLIVAEPCHKKRPFICTLATKRGENGKPIKVHPSLKIGKKNFHLFIAPITWDEALSQCHDIGMKLAKVSTAYEFEMIRNRMQRSRPIIENAWVNGVFLRDKWVWMENHEAINVDPNTYDASFPFPWYRPGNIISDGCLLVDNHVCERLVYVEARCDRKRNYICEEDTGEESIRPLITRVPGEEGFYISNYKETWFTALDMCAKCVKGELLRIEPTRESVMDTLAMLYTAMALTLKEEIQHVWVGGYLFRHKFKWTTSDATEPDDSHTISAQVLEDLSGSGERGILTYCESDFDTDDYLLEYECLNMDRENQKNFMLYGLKCQQKQHYICYTPSETNVSQKCLTGGYQVLRLLENQIPTG